MLAVCYDSTIYIELHSTWLEPSTFQVRICATETFPADLPLRILDSYTMSTVQEDPASSDPNPPMTATEVEEFYDSHPLSYPFLSKRQMRLAKDVLRMLGPASTEVAGAPQPVKVPGSVKRGRLAAEAALAASKQRDVTLAPMEGKSRRGPSLSAQTVSRPPPHSEASPDTPSQQQELRTQVSLHLHHRHSLDSLQPTDITKSVARGQYTANRAFNLAAELQNRPLPFENLPESLERVDKSGSIRAAREGSAPRLWQEYYGHTTSPKSTWSHGLRTSKSCLAVASPASVSAAPRMLPIAEKTPGSVRHALATIHERQAMESDTSGVNSSKHLQSEPSLSLGNFCYVSAGSRSPDSISASGGSKVKFGSFPVVEEEDKASSYIRRHASFWRGLCGRHPFQR